MYDGFCTWCDEEVFIMDQYDDLDMDPPSADSDFMKKYNESVNRKKDCDGNT